jgi:hypothetical protein
MFVYDEWIRELLKIHYMGTQNNGLQVLRFAEFCQLDTTNFQVLLRSFLFYLFITFSKEEK